jgi:hypothetical protein
LALSPSSSKSLHSCARLHILNGGRARPKHVVIRHIKTKISVAHNKVVTPVYNSAAGCRRIHFTGNNMLILFSRIFLQFVSERDRIVVRVRNSSQWMVTCCASELRALWCCTNNFPTFRTSHTWAHHWCKVRSGLPFYSSVDNNAIIFQFAGAMYLMLLVEQKHFSFLLTNILRIVDAAPGCTLVFHWLDTLYVMACRVSRKSYR